MRICLLTNQDLDADPFPADDWPCDPRPFLPEATWHVAVLEKRTSVEQIKKLVADGYDLFFNLCDGAADQDEPGIEVVETLEEHRVPFTGANSASYEPTRDEMKEACRAQGIATPRHAVVRSEAEAELAAERLTFPLFVKHHNSYASVSLSRHSRVRTPAGLRRQVRKMVSRFGAALVEEYIDGIECTVLVAENPDDPQRPTTYTPMQYRFPEGERFKHSKLKWVDYDALSSFPVAEPALAAELRDAAARFFVAMGGVSFARCDIRVDEEGTPFMLEINPNCGVFYPPTDPGSADLCLLREPAGHERFARQLVRAALNRYRRAFDEGRSVASVDALRLHLADEEERVDTQAEAAGQRQDPHPQRRHVAGRLVVPELASPEQLGGDDDDKDEDQVEDLQGHEPHLL